MKTMRLGILVAGLLLVVVGAGVWWMRSPPEAPPEVPFPEGITDEEVRAVLEAVRQKLLVSQSSGNAWGEYGTVLLANLFDQEAVKCFVQAERLALDDPRWPYARGQVALKRAPEKAISLLKVASQRAQQVPQYRQAFDLTLAEALLEMGETDAAAELFQEYLNAPKPQRSQYGLGLVARARGDDGDAERLFREAVAHPACRKQAKVQLAILARARNDIATASQLEAEAGALNADPPWPDPYLDYVVTLQVGYRGLQRRTALLERDGKFQQALELNLQQVKEKRTCAALTSVGINLARLDRYDDAVHVLREAVGLDDLDANAHYTLALVLFTKLEIAITEDPKLPGALAGFREVIEHAKKTIDRKPDHARAMLFWGLALKHLGEPKEAIEPLRRGLTIEPQTFDLHLGLGQVLAATGDRVGAEASFKAAQQIKPMDPRPAQELAKLK